MKLKKNKITITSKDQFDAKKPIYDGYAVGHGAHGDTKYNRRKQKKETRKIIDDELK